jgi:Flp pilus assembly protein TadG
MALVLPVLLFLLMAMIDFGRAYNGQIRLSAASREGVRLASLNTAAIPKDDVNYGDSAIRARVTAAGGPSVLAVVLPAGTPPACPVNPTPNSVCIIYCPADAAAAATASATVVVTSQFSWITGISGMSKFFGSGSFPTPSTVQATGVMRCIG